MAEPHLSFRNAELKVEWACKHIDQLSAALDAYKEAQPAPFVRNVEGEEEEYELCLVDPNPIPHDLALIAGDAVSNLRSALDYCWMGLARSLGPTGKFTIPIGTDRHNLITSIQATAVGKAFPKTELLVGETIAFHRDEAGGGNLALCALNDLANWNKHNLILLAIKQTHVSSLAGPWNSFLFNNTFQGNKPAIRFSGFKKPPSVQNNAKPNLEIIFGAHDLVQGEPILPTLRNMAQACVEAVSAFSETFPE